MVPFIYTHSQVERGERDRDSKKEKETKTTSLSMEREKMRGRGEYDSERDRRAQKPHKSQRWKGKLSGVVTVTQRNGDSTRNGQVFDPNDPPLSCQLSGSSL